MELNVTAMLDMAFQLLAFFVLTFKPPPAEFQIYLKLPPAQPVQGFAGTQAAGADDTKDIKDVKPTKTLVVTVLDDNGGGTISTVNVSIPGVSAQGTPVPFNDLEKELRTYFRAKDENEASGQKGNAQGDFEQAVINASPTLRWDEILKVMEIFTRFTTAKGGLPAVSVSAAGPDPDTGPAGS